MSNSILHDLLTDIRIKYTGKKVTILDIRDIEEKYRFCSIVNFRFDNSAFLRITSFGTGEVTFEDVVVNSNVLNSISNDNDLLFNAQKVLYKLSYGVELVNEEKRYLNGHIEEPPFDFETIRDEVEILRKKCADLERKLEISQNKPDQMSLFDDQ